MPIYKIEFDIVSLIISCIAFIVFHKQKQMNTKRNSMFYVIIICISLSAVFSLLNSLALNRLATSSIYFAYITNILYLAFHTHVPFLFCLYIFILTEYSLPNLVVRIIFALPWITFLVLIFGNPFHHALFYFTKNQYHRGSFHLVLYYLTAIYIGIALLVLFLRKRKLNTIEISSFLVALIFPLIAIFLQIFLQGMILENFSLSISVLFLLLIVQNDKNLIDVITGLQNNLAFNIVLRDNLLQKSSFSITFVHSRELKAIQTYLDNDTYNSLLQKISAWFINLAKKRFHLFSLNDHLFALVSTRHVKDETIGELSLDIIRRSQEAWELGEIEIQLTFQTSIIRVPDDCKTTNQIRDYIEQFIDLTEIYSDRHIIFAKDFVPENHLRQARIAYALQEKIEKNVLDIVYQPIYATKTKGIFAIEALISLPLNDGDTIQQSEILKVAERIGLGKRLGECIIKNVFSWYVSERLEQHNLFVQIRLLESFCFEINWAQNILEIAKKTGMSLSFLCLQLTETAIANTLDNLKHNMDFLKSKNVSFALDDYGSGYTDFGEILEIPFTTVKLDKKIVHAAFVDIVEKRLLEGSVSLFRKLNWPIVAEGVETDEHMTYLQELGLEYFQGYKIGYPEKGEILLEQLKKQF